MDKIKIIKSLAIQYKECKFLSNVLGTLMINIQVQQINVLIIIHLKIHLKWRNVKLFNFLKKIPCLSKCSRLEI